LPAIGEGHVAGREKKCIPLCVDYLKLLLKNPK
jgi:hypothetical protein